MIRRAKPDDIAEIEKSYNEVMLHEQSHVRYTVWQQGVYPTRKTAEIALSDGSLYVMEKSGKMRASMIINHIAPKEYESIPWKCAASPSEVLVVHLLCVRPSEAGRGLGKEMMTFAIEEAKRRNCTAVRLDTGSQNVPAKSLYAKLGFEHRGTAPMAIGGTIPHKNHLFFELAVKSISRQLQNTGAKHDNGFF